MYLNWEHNFAEGFVKYCNCPLKRKSRNDLDVYNSENLDKITMVSFIIIIGAQRAMAVHYKAIVLQKLLLFSTC